MKKIAIPTSNNMVDDHFGHCDCYIIFTLSDNKEIVREEIIRTQQGCGCKTGIATRLTKNGVSLILAGNIGMRAKERMNAEGIKVLCGFDGNVKDALNRWIQGFEGNNTICGGHEHQHHGEQY